MILWSDYPHSLENKGNSSYTKFQIPHTHFESLANTITAMLSSNLPRDYRVIHQFTLCMSILAFDAALSVLITKRILLFFDIFCQ